jgi:hypothetical protein
MDGSEYLRAPVDPIASQAREIIEYMNSKYPEELKLMCKEYGDVDVDNVFMMSCDRCDGRPISALPPLSSRSNHIHDPIDGDLICLVKSSLELGWSSDYPLIWSS